MRTLLIWVFSLILGVTFVYSSWHKIVEPTDFAHVVHNYQLLPGSLINAVAIYMPWFEAIAGLAFLTWLFRRGAALGIGVLCILFIAALGYNLYRGHPTICGCFDTFAAGKKLTEAEKFFKMKTEMALDAGLFILSMMIFFGSRRSCEPEVSE